MISNYSKDFPWEKVAQICQISNFLKIQISPESYDNFQKAAKNLEGFCYISSLHIY
jgi:hypothetical protein